MKSKHICVFIFLAALSLTCFNIGITSHTVINYFKGLFVENTSKYNKQLIQEIYGKVWNSVITPYETTVLIDGRNICNDAPTPILLLFVMSLPDRSVERQAIRQTWGSVAKMKNEFLNIHAKLVFLLGVIGDNKTSGMLVEESHKHMDIVQFDLRESRYNLTSKMMQGFKWIETFCRRVQYILKADDDTFVNIARISDYMLQAAIINKNTIHGYLYPRGGIIEREGKYAVTKAELPIFAYPPYVSGTAYILPFDVISDMIELAEMLPYCPVDDAFITGVLRTILNVNIQHSGDFTNMMELKFHPCVFHTKIAVTNIGAKCMNMLWLISIQDSKGIACKYSTLYNKSICPIFE